jgi:acyl carrier protein
MNHIRESEVIELIMVWIKKNKDANDFAGIEILPKTDLMTGLLNSFDFIELFLFLEAETGCKIDLTDVDPSEFAVIEGLCRLVLRSRDGAYKHAVGQ